MIRLSHSELHPIPLPRDHRFPIAKYGLVREQLEYEGAITAAQLFSPEFVDDGVIGLTHSPEWWRRARAGTLGKDEYRRIGFPNAPALVTRSISSASGTLHCAVNALQDGAGMNLAGGTHHAFFDRGGGFCLLNDVAIAANYLLHKGLVRQVLVVDLDVHQGDGTAELFAGRPEVYTFSMHCAENFPFRKMKSDLDLSLPAGMGDARYLEGLGKHIPRLLEEVRPDIVFYVAGVDVLATDKLGKLSLTKAGCKRRDEMVIAATHQRGIPLVVVMGGGYSDQLSTIVHAHCETFKLVLDYYEKPILHTK